MASEISETAERYSLWAITGEHVPSNWYLHTLNQAIHDKDYQKANDCIAVMDPTLFAPDATGYMPLFYASTHGDYNTCVSLLRVMDDVDVLARGPKSSLTVLHLALRQGNTWFIDALLEAKPRLLPVLANAESKAGLAPISYASSCRDSRIFNILLTHTKPKYLMSPGSYGQTILHTAVVARNTELIEALMNHGYLTEELVRAKAMFGQTPLMYAAKEPNLYIFQLLFRACKSPDSLLDKEETYHRTVKQFAVEAENIEAVRLLLGEPTAHYRLPMTASLVLREYGIRNSICTQSDCLRVRSTDPQTILQQVAQVKNGLILDLIICESDRVLKLLGMTNKIGETVLHLAVKAGNADICRILYNRMSPWQICTRDTNGLSVLDVAIAKGYVPVINILLGNRLKSSNLFYRRFPERDEMMQRTRRLRPDIYQLLSRFAQTIIQSD